MSFTPREPADYIPTRGNYTELKPFRFWCQKVLPLVYDDSLSYYELLCKVVDFLNKTMEDVETLEDDTTAMYSAYNQLQSFVNDSYSELVGFVNDYFDNLDVQEEINNKLDAMAQDGSLSALISPFIPNIVTAWLNEHVSPTSPAIDNTLTISGAGADARKTGETVSNVYNSSLTYKRGQYVLQNGTLYKALTDIDTPEAFNVSHWINTNITKNMYTEWLNTITSGYQNGAIIRDGTIPNSGNTNCVVVGIFDLMQYEDFMMFNLVTDRPVDEGYEYYYNYAICPYNIGEPDYSTEISIIGDISTTTRKLNVPIALNVTPEYKGVMFCVAQKDANGNYSPLRKEDFIKYGFRLEPYGDHYTYSVRNGSFANPANANQITSGVFPVKEGDKIKINFDKPLESQTNKYCIGYRFISNASQTKNLNYANYNNYIVSSADVSVNRTIDTILTVPSGAIGIIVLIGEYTSDNSNVPISTASAKNYNISVSALDFTPVRNGSYLNSGNPDVVTTPWYKVAEGDIVTLYTDRPSTYGNYYRVGYVISSEYSEGYNLDMNPLVNVSYDRELPILLYGDSVTIPSGALGICFIISEYDGTEYNSIRDVDFINYKVTVEKENKNIPDYWINAINDTEDAINAYCDSGENTFSFAFITDTHIGANKKHSVILANKIMKDCRIPLLLHGGDAVTGSGANTPKSALIDSFNEDYNYFNDIEFEMLKITGNHEPAYGMTNYEGNITVGELYNYYFRHNEKNNDFVYGANNSYFYKDNKAQKVRYICMNIVNYASQINSSGAVVGANKLTQFLLGNDQLNWLCDALNVPDDYDVIILTHCPMVEDSRFSAIDPSWVETAPVDLSIFTGIIEAYHNKTTYSVEETITFGNLTENYSINCDFSNYTGDLICCVSGHTHHDIMFKINGINHICTANDSSTVSGVATTYVPQKAMLTNTEQIIDFFCINKSSKQGKVVRLGASTQIYGNVRTFTW